MTPGQRLLNQARWYRNQVRLYLMKLRRARDEGGASAARSEMRQLYGAHRARGLARDYDRWVRDRVRTRLTHPPSVPAGPTFSIVVPVFRPEPNGLRSCLESVVGQTYPHWNLIAIDDGGGDHEVEAILSRYAAKDRRISVEVLPENVGIGLATQKGLDLATGEYVCFLDHDDQLTPDALLLAASKLSESPAIDFLYADEDKMVSSGRYAEPSFRPDVNSDLLLSYNFVSHPIAVRRQRIEAVGGMRVGFDGSQDHDLALRLQDDGAEFGHLSEVLYHWRVSKGSAAGSVHAKPYAVEAGIQAVRDSMKRQNVAASVRRGLVPGHYEILFQPPAPTRVGIVVATNAPAHKVLDRIRYVIEPQSDAIETEVVLVRTPVEAADHPDNLMEWPARWAHVNGECIAFDGWPNKAAAHNSGAKHVNDVEFLVFVDENVRVVEAGTLSQVLGNLSRDGVGVVGTVALRRDMRIINAGIEVDAGVVRGAYAGDDWGSTGHHDLARRMREVSALPVAVMVTRRRDFDALGGFSERFPLKYFDIAYCLDVRSKLGLRVVLDPLFPVLWKGYDRLEVAASDHEEIAFAALVNKITALIDPYSGHNNPAAIPLYAPEHFAVRR